MSGKGFVFSLEACFSLLACLVFVSSLSVVSTQDFSRVIVYKQGSDFLELVVEDGSLEDLDVRHMKKLLSSVGLKGKLVIDGIIVFDQHPREVVRIRRLVFMEEEYKKVVLVAGS